MLAALDIPVHLWIVYAFLFNGFLLNLVFCSVSHNYLRVLVNVEAWFLSSFFLSILLNGSVLLLLSRVGYSFDNMSVFLPLFSVSAVFFLGFKRFQKKGRFILVFPESDWVRLLLYCFVFFILIINGGLIEKIADSWWHLSLTKKIALFNSFDAELIQNHLDGVLSRYYPTLWHGNLAMLHKISSISLPVLWNVFTAWGGVLKVMGFYLLALGVSSSNRIALLSIVLFVLLPGLGDSYLRVSAWPSHVAYSAWFCMFYIAFLVFDEFKKLSDIPEQSNPLSIVSRLFFVVRQSKVKIISFLVLALVVFSAHQAELLWFALGLFFYAITLLTCNLFFDLKDGRDEPAKSVLYIYLVFGLCCVVSLVYLRYWPLLMSFHELSDKHLILLLWSGIVLFLLYLLMERSPLSALYYKRLAKTLFCVVLLLLMLSIDMRQLCSLFNPEFEYPRPALAGWSVFCSGWLGDPLKLPDWNIQLRNGLLYSGVLAVVVSLVMLFLDPRRCTLFLAANSVIPFLFLISPYLYQGFMDGVNYLSSWRIALLIFHPIVLACFIDYLCSGMIRWVSNQ